MRYEFTLDQFRFEPKPEDLEPTLPIPEGTRVMVTNAPGIAAKWSRGKLVMNYDKPVVADLKGTWVSEEKSVPLWRRPLALAAGALLVLVAGILAWRRMATVAS